jgi:hypothetical protein
MLDFINPCPKRLNNGTIRRAFLVGQSEPDFPAVHFPLRQKAFSLFSRRQCRKAVCSKVSQPVRRCSSHG